MAYQIVQIDTNKLTPNKAIGVKFPFNGPGIFKKTYTTLEQASTNVRNLLLTRKGERYEQPDFGTDLLNILFEPNVTDLKDFISDTISDAISFWLPYITITKLNIITLEDDPTLLHDVKIKVTFTVTGADSEKTITIFAGQNGILKVE
jgi:phage baseplate assembly protein W